MGVISFFLITLFKVCILTVTALHRQNEVKYLMSEDLSRGKRQAGDGDGTCFLGANQHPDLQVVFVVDAALPKETRWPSIQQEMTSDMMRMIKKSYKVQFGLTTYQSWKGNNCYNLLQTFTNQPDVIMQKLKGLAGETGFDINSNSSLTMALLMTIADKKLNWVKEVYPTPKAAVRKVVVAYPLRLSDMRLENSGNRKEPIGNGLDTCENSLPPTSKTLQLVVEKNNMVVVLGLFELHGRSNALEKFYFDGIFPKGFDRVTGAVHNKFVSGVGMGYQEVDIIPGSFRRDAGNLFDLMEDEVNVCIWEDPEPYNTVGF